MKKILKYNSIVLMVLLFFIFSCDKEDYTDYSTLVPTKPTVTITVANSNITLVEQNATYTFDVTLSEAQISDVAVYITVVEGGTATLNEDFIIDNMSNKVNIPASKLSGTAVIKVLADDLQEPTETFTIQIGDERTGNVNITYATVNFTITNSVQPELTVDLSWETDIADVIGDVGLDPDEIVDLRFLIIDPSDESVVLVIDGGSFESFGTLTDTLADGSYLADGDYVIAVDIYSTINLGYVNVPITLDLELKFNQYGVHNSVIYEFPAAMTNEYVCTEYRTLLATITKTGSDFTLVKALSYWNEIATLDRLTGTWNGVDAETAYTPNEPSQATSAIVNDTLRITGLGFGWMNNFWGEVVDSGGTAYVIVDLENGTLDIPDQYYMTTLYGGEIQDDYTIVGTGTFATCGYSTMKIEYEVTNYETAWAAWCYANGYMSTPLFVATLTLDPDGKWRVVSNKPIDFEKPFR